MKLPVRKKKKYTVLTGMFFPNLTGSFINFRSWGLQYHALL